MRTLPLSEKLAEFNFILYQKLYFSTCKILNICILFLCKQMLNCPLLCVEDSSVLFNQETKCKNISHGKNC